VGPVMTLTGTRSPTPATSQYAKRSMLSVVAAPLSSSAKTWSSSIFWYSPGDGYARTTAGPPVEKANFASAAIAAPATDLMPGCGATLHFVPGGRSLAKSNTQVLSSTQRAVPAWVPAGVQATSSGAGSRGSPNLTMDSLNVARTWRTSATSPLGDIVFSVASARAANGTTATNAIHPAASPRLHCMTCSPACGEAVYVGPPRRAGDRERSLTARSAVSRDL